MIRGIGTAKKLGTFLITVPLCGGLAAAALAVCDRMLAAQTSGAKVKLRVALVDKDLSVKPVPKLALTLQPKSSPAAAPVGLTTGFDGQTEIDVAPGEYRLSTPQAVDFQGKQYSWELDIKVKDGQNDIELSNNNAKIVEVGALPARVTDELTTQFKRLQNSVVTVWSEVGHGTGFLIDPQGLVLTNQHVIGPSEYIALQFDPQRKIEALLLAADAKKDIAVLWANFTQVPEAVVSPIAKAEGGEAPVMEGEKVFTIGSPLSQRKIITTGIASKVEPRAIISDININPGNSGGPLFSSLGAVVGITTFGERGGAGGAGVSGIVRIEEAAPLIAQAKAKMASTKQPSPALLPVEPAVMYPIDAIKTALAQERFETKPYRFGAGDFEVGVITPLLRYYYVAGSGMHAAKEKGKRTKKKKEAVHGTFQPLEDLKDWAEYAGEYQPLIFLRATPKLRETTGSKWRRGMLGGLSGTGYGGPATVRFKTDFYKMKLKCGAKEVQPIHPGKIAHVMDVQNPFIHATDATYEGFYSYPPDAISPSCGQVAVELYSEKNPSQPTVKILGEETVSRVWADFEPYRKATAANEKK